MGLVIYIFFTAISLTFSAVPPEIEQNSYYQYFKKKTEAIALAVKRQEAVVENAKFKFDKSTEMRLAGTCSDIEHSQVEADYKVSLVTLDIFKKKVEESKARMDIIVSRIQNKQDIPIDLD